MLASTEEWTSVSLLVLLCAMFGATVWTLWRKKIVNDLHRVRQLLEEREYWEKEIVSLLRQIVSNKTKAK